MITVEWMQVCKSVRGCYPNAHCVCRPQLANYNKHLLLPMLRVLLVKTSSLGDVIHNLPVVHDILQFRPDAVIDWVVEESFSAIPRLHQGVSRVIPMAVRRWRREITRASSRCEIGVFRRHLREQKYDAIIDTQGLLKSAIISCDARGQRYGLDWRSSREPLRMFYDRTFRVPWGQHAVERNRSLAAQALGYALTTTARFDIKPAELSAPAKAWLPQARYAVLLHATSAARKLWPESHWREVIGTLLQKDIVSVLPWGSSEEHNRSVRIAAGMPHTIVPPALALPDLAGVLGRASVVVGVDTGLTHLAAALQVPTAGIYCATDPEATGLYPALRAVNIGGKDIVPSVLEVIAAMARISR